LVFLDGESLPDEVYDSCDLATLEERLISALKAGEYGTSVYICRTKSDHEPQSGIIAREELSIVHWRDSTTAVIGVILG